MRKLLLVILATLFVMVANSQNYRFFNDDYTLYEADYGNDYYPYQTLNIDTVGSVLKYEFQTMLNVSIDPMYYNVNGPGFIGQFVDWDTANHVYYFYNLFNDTIKLYTNLPADTSWIAYQKDSIYVEAESFISNIYVHNDSVIDTVKRIEFNCYGINPNYSFQDEHLLISSLRGLLKITNIAHFPEFYENYSYPMRFQKVEDSLIIEMFNPDIVDSISNAQIFDFNTGDVFHVVQEYGDYFQDHYSWTTIKSRYKVLDRVMNAENTALTYERQFKRWENYEVTYQAIDTFVNTYGFNPMNGLPPLRYEGVEGDCMIYHLTVSHNRPTLYLPNAFYLKIEDGIWEQMHGDAPKEYRNTPTSKYIVGLGGPYYSFYGFAADTRNLVYYNVSGEEWGTPLTFTVGVNDIELESLKVYPNPVKDRLIINSSNLNSDADLMIFDMSGKTIMNRKIHQWNSQIELNVSNLNAGVYTIQIVNGQQILTNKFIKLE